MTSHQLAKLLLEAEDLPVVHWVTSGGYDDRVEIERINLSEPGDQYDSGTSWGRKDQFIFIS